jgi:hypothetical protein
MTELLDIIFRSFWSFAGTCILLLMLAGIAHAFNLALALVVAAVRSQHRKGRVRHLARGTNYDVIGLGMFQISSAASGAELVYDNMPVVVYQGEDGMLWVRMAKNFLDGRFTPKGP